MTDCKYAANTFQCGNDMMTLFSLSLFLVLSLCSLMQSPLHLSPRNHFNVCILLYMLVQKLNWASGLFMLLLLRAVGAAVTPPK